MQLCMGSGGQLTVLHFVQQGHQRYDLMKCSGWTAIYSASVVDRAVSVCSLEPHESGHPAKQMMYLVLDCCDGVKMCCFVIPSPAEIGINITIKQQAAVRWVQHQHMILLHCCQVPDQSLDCLGMILLWVLGESSTLVDSICNVRAGCLTSQES